MHKMRPDDVSRQCGWFDQRSLVSAGSSAAFAAIIRSQREFPGFFPFSNFSLSKSGDASSSKENWRTAQPPSSSANLHYDLIFISSHFPSLFQKSRVFVNYRRSLRDVHPASASDPALLNPDNISLLASLAFAAVLRVGARRTKIGRSPASPFQPSLSATTETTMAQTRREVAR